MKTIMIILFAFLTLFCPQSLSAQGIDYKKGLVAYYPFNGNANDESGNGRHGIVYGATLTNDRNGIANQAYKFDGYNDYIDTKISSLGVGNYNFSICFWVKPDFLSDNVGYDRIITKGGDTRWNSEWMIQQSGNNNQIEFTLYGQGYKSVKIDINKDWQYIVCVFENNIIKIYNNSNLIESIPFGNKINLNNKSILFGACNPTQSISFFRGELDDIRIYNRSLIEEEIKVLYNIENIKGKIITEKNTNNINEPQVPPVLFLSNINFVDKNGNNRIDANEECYIAFTISNKGKGSARNLKVKISNNSNIQGLKYNNIFTIGNINPSTSQTVNVPISGTINLTSGTANIKVSFEEQMGFQPDPFELNIETKEFIKPNIQVVDHSFLTDNGIIQLGLPVQLKVLIQNIGQGIAENVNVSFQYPSSNVFPNGPKDFEIGTLQPGATKELIFEFIANKLYTEKNIPVTARINEKYGRFSENKQVFANIDAKSSGTAINIASNVVDSKVNIQVASLTAEVDKNIPLNPIKYPDRYALIIGNEDYSSRQRGLGAEVDVAFAVNDAKIFKEYCVNTLGVEEKNVFLLTNATAGEMHQRIELVTQILSRLGSKGELIFYYAGHGFPDENTKEPYLIPVDVTATNLSAAIKLNDVYKKFSQTGSKRITVFLDACFTGGGRESGLLAARGVKVRPREEIVSGNMVIFAATSEDQSALPYKDKQHGMFTYFLLKKLQETKGDVSYGALEEFIRNNVSIESLKINNKAQDPKANVSQQAKTEWETWKLK